jgi:alpha-ketoglutarate-dependent taurine dioxygenase
MPYNTRKIKPTEQLFTTKYGDFIHIIDAHESGIEDFINFCNLEPNWIHQQLKQHGAIILKNFKVRTAQEFENCIAELPGFKPIAEAFMAEEGRVHVGNLKYVLYTNKAYKTGGTLYLGGFHSENYYSTDVPNYICFFCEKPSKIGGETGLINTQKVYDALSTDLKAKLKTKPFFAKRCLLSEIANRYNEDPKIVRQQLADKGLKITNVGNDALIDMYKPSIFHDLSCEKNALQINFFQLI